MSASTINEPGTLLPETICKQAKAIVDAVVKYGHYDTDGNWWIDYVKAQHHVGLLLQRSAK